jgi:DNA repair protein RadA/Sms
VSGAEPIGAARPAEEARIATGLPGLDRVLGGGIVPGSVVLLGGEPGIGKSTLLLQAARGIARSAGEVLYVSGEESASQVRLRGERLGIAGDSDEKLLVLAETDVTRVLAECEGRSQPPAVLVVDSVQAIRDPALASAPGTVSSVRECALALQRWAKARTVPVLLIGHVTKDGSLAGPKSLEHLVDAVVTVEGERGSSRRIVRATKNRFGPVEELALYEMTGAGLTEIANPSAALLAERRGGAAGSAVSAVREGSRALLVEIQALVGPPTAGSPRRVALGVDPGRLALLLAVLESSGIPLATREVFASCAGGLDVREPGCDLALVASILSSVRGEALPADAVYFGEVGLLGEVRSVPACASRLREAAGLGFTRAFLPAGNAADAAGFPEIRATPVSRVTDLVRPAKS